MCHKVTVYYSGNGIKRSAFKHVKLTCSFSNHLPPYPVGKSQASQTSSQEDKVNEESVGYSLQNKRMILLGKV